MALVLEYVIIALLLVLLSNWLFKAWKKLDLEARKNEIEEIEKQYKTIGEIEKHYPDYKTKKEYVEKFKQ